VTASMKEELLMDQAADDSVVVYESRVLGVACLPMVCPGLSMCWASENDDLSKHSEDP